MIADRIAGCLKGIAIGDAIGKQTETLSPAHIARWYPNGVRGFEGTPGTIIPRYVGNSKHEWRIGETTDDTERTIAVARALIRDRGASHVSIGREMLGCVKCVHPGVKSLWEFHQASDPARIATMHDGCGAAVRVAPVGIVHRPENLEALVTDAREASISTHGGSLAIAAAAARGGTGLYPEVELQATASSSASKKTTLVKTATGAVTLMFLLCMLLAGMVMSNLVEEKANKIIEILAAAIPMDAVFLGKLFAMLGVSFVGLAVWGGLAGLAIATGSLGVESFPTPAVGWPTFVGR